jgi:hypothetical protein
MRTYLCRRDELSDQIERLDWAIANGAGDAPHQAAARHEERRAKLELLRVGARALGEVFE